MYNNTSLVEKWSRHKEKKKKKKQTYKESSGNFTLHVTLSYEWHLPF